MRLLAPVVLTLLLAGCSSPGIEQHDAVDRTVPARGSVEVRVELDEGKRIDYSWTAQGTLRFEVRNEQGQVLLSRDAAADSGPFTATQDGTYTVAWVNNGLSPVDVRYTLRAYGNILD